MQSGQETDIGLVAYVLDKAWALVLVVLAPLVGWAFGHEKRLTRLEAQHEECERARERYESTVSDMRHELQTMNSKLDHLIGAVGGKNRLP